MHDRWPEAPLGEVASIVRGVSWSKDQETWNSGAGAVPVVRIGNVQATGIDMSERLFIRGASARDLELKAIQADTILMVGSNGNPKRVGNVYISRPELAGHLFASFIIGINVADTCVPQYVWRWLQQETVQEQITQATAGSTGLKNLGLHWLRSLPILLPPLDEQRRIVDLIAAVDEAVLAADTVALHARASFERTLAQTVTGDGQPTVALGDVAAVDLDRVTVKPGHTYQIAGVLNAGQGLLKRDSIDGRATNYAALQRLRTNQLVMRKLTAWEGPITVVTEDFDGYFVSPEFPTFTLDKTRVVPGYVRHLCKSPILWAAMRDESTGSVQRRKRVSPQRLLTIHIPLPTILEQSRCAQRLSAFEAVQEAAAQVRTKAVALRSALLANLLSGDHEIPASYDKAMG